MGIWEKAGAASVNGGRFEISQLLFADDTTLVADVEAKLCRLVSEFGRVCDQTLPPFSPPFKSTTIFTQQLQPFPKHPNIHLSNHTIHMYIKQPWRHHTILV